VIDPNDTTDYGPLMSFRCTRFGVTCSTGGGTPDDMNTVGTKDGCTDNTTSALVQPVAFYHDYLATLKGDARAVTVEVIAGTPTPVAVELDAPTGQTVKIPALTHSCTYQGADGPEVADPAVRLTALAQMFPDHNAFATVCEQDLSGSLALLGQVAIEPLGNPCLSQTLADADPNTAGVQHECTATDVTSTGSTAIPACDANKTPTCWELVTDTTSCIADDHLELVIHRPTGSTPDPSTVTYLRCKI
jgi:hypothetical protein